MSLATPVAYIAYNRPSHAARTFRLVAQAKPETLFIILDGPKEHVPGDAEKCAAVRNLLSQIDWKCTVRLNVSADNIGSRKRVQSGLDWVFRHVDRAIVVEDDCLLDPSFFQFADELLAYYENDSRVGIICAQGDELPSNGASYHASRYPVLWGWATWRRTWQLYEPDIESWPSTRTSDLLMNALKNPLAAAYWRGQLDRTYAGLDAWDYQVNYCCWRHDLLCIHPAVNMLSNIGFDAEATNTVHRRTPFGEATSRMDFPIRHPATLAVSQVREARLLDLHYGISSEEALKRVRTRVAIERAGDAG